MDSSRILLADDRDLVRAGIRALLERVADFEVVGESRDGRDALNKIQQLSPHVVLMDLMMPELNGLDATAMAKHRFLDVRVLILSMNADENFVFPALQAGACGYLLKNIAPAELETAIRAVTRGDMYLASAFARPVVERCLERLTQEGEHADVLTPRQREVLQLLAEGHSSKEIAQKLQISVRTAEVHRAQLMRALGIHDLAGLVRYAIRIGMVSVDR